MLPRRTVGPSRNLVPCACDPREGTRGSGIILGKEREALGDGMHSSNLSQDSWLPAMDYPRASRSFLRIAGSGNEIGPSRFHLSPDFPSKRV